MTAAEIWYSMDGEGQLLFLERMTWYEYSMRYDVMPSGEPKPNFFCWVDEKNPAQNLEDVRQAAYIKVVELLEKNTYGENADIRKYVSRAVLLAAQDTQREQRRNGSALKTRRASWDATGNGDMETYEEAYIVMHAAPIAEPIAPDPFTALLVSDAIERACKDDIDRAIVDMLTPPGKPTYRQIGAALHISHVAVAKRVKAIRERYNAD